MDLHYVAMPMNPTICVYPVNGQYQFLPRLLFYFLFLFGVVWRKQGWLLVGALVSSLTYAGATAVHAIILAGFSYEAAFDLDALPCAMILTFSVLVSIALLRCPTTWHCPGARWIFPTWITLVSTGLTCAVVALFRYGTLVSEASCRSETGGAVLMSPFDFSRGDTFNCTYACFSSASQLRDSDTIRAMFLDRLDAPISLRYIHVALAGIAFITMCSSSAQAWLTSLNCASKPRTNCYIADNIWYRLAIFLLVIQVVLSESAMHLEPSIPVSESLGYVGQWAPWVVAGLVLLAGILNRCDRGKNDEGAWCSEYKDSPDETNLQTSPTIAANAGTLTTTVHL